jgi:hypothetical protein
MIAQKQKHSGLAVLDRDDRADRGCVAAPAVVVGEVPLRGRTINGPRIFAIIAVSVADA